MPDGTYFHLAEAILTAHQRRDSGSCLCGWNRLGESWSTHVAEVLDAAGALRDKPPKVEEEDYG